MPNMNGIEFITAMRKLGDNTPIIFFTAFGDQELMDEGNAQGAFDFIAKPDFSKLLSTIQKIIDTSK